MKVEEIAEAIAMLPPDQLARFRRWFAAFEVCRSDHAKELDSTAIKLGRLAGRALAELRRRVEEPYSGPIELPSARQSSEIVRCSRLAMELFDIHDQVSFSRSLALATLRLS
jgi:hypothetical protein